MEEEIPHLIQLFIERPWAHIFGGPLGCNQQLFQNGQKIGSIHHRPSIKQTHLCFILFI